MSSSSKESVGAETKRRLVACAVPKLGAKAQAQHESQ